jgi:uncharacterized protein YbaP (TraB family)
MRIALLATALAFATPAAAQAPALWSVRDADTTIYLLGSVHAFDGGPSWLAGDIAAAYDASSEIVLETVVLDLQSAGALALKYGKANRRLRSYMPKADAAKLEAVLAAAEVKKSALDNYAPWFANSFVATMALSASGLSREMSVEVVLQDRAKRDGKKLIGLESNEEQIAIFNQIPIDAQLRWLSKTLNDPNEVRSVTQLTTRCWRVGDLACVDQASTREFSGIEGVRNALLLSRNQRWATWVAERMQQPGIILVAVGISHFTGPDSLIDQLRKSGLTVARVGPAAN